MTADNSPSPNTLWDRFLGTLLNPLIDEAAMNRKFARIDWETERRRLENPDLDYPDYYSSQNFHGVRGGYLNPGAAVSYDPITQYVLPPNETWVREGTLEALRSQPRRILDLGCGTGSTTLLLKQHFPNAEVVGLDLSPDMLVMAQYKASHAGLKIQWQHGKAEDTGFPEASFDVITLSLLFHETPPEIAQAILKECFRLLRVGGEVVLLDGNQQSLRQTPWLMEVFEEPYIADYAQGDVGQWMQAAGFAAVETCDRWWIHQVTRGVKPLASGDVELTETTAMPEMAFGV